MKRVITAVILIPLVLLLVCNAPLWVVCLVVGVLAMITTAEYLLIVAGHDLDPLRVPTFIVIGIFFLMHTIMFASTTSELNHWMADHMYIATHFDAAMGLVAFLFSFIGLIYLVLALRVKPLSKFLPSAVASGFAVAYIAMPLRQLLLVEKGYRGSLLVVYGLIVVWTGDIAAYYVGRNLGKRLFAPNVSPKKTWEGAIASFVASVALGSLILMNHEWFTNLFLSLHLNPGVANFRETGSVSWWAAILASACINIAGQVGDLVESAMKRGAQIKDSGALLPGHGGVLDRIDALLFAAPVLWYYASTNLIHF